MVRARDENGRALVGVAVGREGSCCADQVKNSSLLDGACAGCGAGAAFLPEAAVCGAVAVLACAGW